MIDGVEVVPLRKFEDERGWFMELRRESELSAPTRQTNVSFSRKGVIRGLHYHERGQNDLFACLHGIARVVVLDRESRETFTFAFRPAIVDGNVFADHVAVLAQPR